MTARTCGATTRAGGRCAQPAGWGTAHPGEGRCKLHGGASPIRHGLYSTVVRGRAQALLEQAATEPVNDSTSEIQLGMALIAEALEQIELAKEAFDAKGEGLARDRLVHVLDLVLRAKDRQLQREEPVVRILAALAETCASIIARYVPEAQRERARRELRDTLVGGAALRAGVGRRARGT